MGEALTANCVNGQRSTVNGNRLAGWTLALLAGTSPPQAQGQQPLSSLIGAVREVGDSGAAIAGAEVLVLRRQVTTDARGAFRIDSLPPGQYSITLRRIGYRPVYSRVVLRAGAATQVEYFLSRAPVVLPTLITEARRTGIYGVVGDSGFHPISGAKVIVLGPNGGEGLTDRLGRFAFPKAHGGTYLVQVTSAGYPERRTVVEVAKEKGRELGFRLAPGPAREPLPGEAEALWELRRRLAFLFRDHRMGPEEVARFGSMRLCDVPKLLTRAGDPTTVVLNGVEVLRGVSLCSWRMNEVELIELCDRGGCPNPDAPRPLIYPGLGRERRRYAVVIWEKR